VGDYRERVGTLTVGATEYPLRLSQNRSMPYQPSYALVWPGSSEIPGASSRVGGDQNVRYWMMDSWSGGEGEDLWKPGEDTFHESTNVRPKTVGDSLILGANQALCYNDGWISFPDSAAFGLALGRLWTGLDTTVHHWHPGLGTWDTTGWPVGAAGSFITSIADGDDTLAVFVGRTDTIIHKVIAGVGAHHTHGFTYPPVVCSFGGNLYALDGDNLYLVDKTAVDTKTLVADLEGSAASYLASDHPYERLSVSDKGPIWFQRLDNGQTLVWEYNEASDTDSRVGMLPVQFAWPYSICWAHGFIFVGFRYAAGDELPGEAFVYYQRGAQRGVAGPIRSASGVTASEGVQVAGCIGDDLMIYYAGAVWAYNLSTGGLYQLAKSISSSSTKIRSAICFGKDVFISNADNAGKVERFQTDVYTTQTTAITTGRFDFDYAGLDLCLLDVTVTTLPLPANTQVTLEVSVEGGTFAAVTGTMSTDGATSYTWATSTAAASRIGRDFELKLILASTDSAVTPTIRSITARTTATERQRMWRLELDTGTWRTGTDGVSPRSADVLADLRAIGESSGLVTFTNPWEGEEQDAPVDYTVMPSQLLYDEAEGVTGIAVLELREAGYV
jgi:hypothetical protein